MMGTMNHQIVDGLQDVNNLKTQEGQETIKVNVFLSGGDTLICLIADFIHLSESLDWMVRLNTYYQRRYNVKWSELKEKALNEGPYWTDLIYCKDYMTGYENSNKKCECIRSRDFFFMKDGDILIERLGILLRIKHITFMEGYEKMWKIMEVLR